MAEKVDLERELESAWAELRSLVDEVPDSELEQPGVVEEWSMKDLFGHIAFWASKAASDVALLRAGREDEIETPGGEEVVAEWNKRESERRRGKSVADLRDEMLKSAEVAREALGDISLELLKTEVKGWSQLERFAADTYIHYREHTEHIRSWMRDLETTEA